MPVLLFETPYYSVFKTNEYAAMIELKVTDAVLDKRPLASKTEKQPTDGVVNYYEQADPKIFLLWKKKLGKLLVTNAVKPDMQATGMECTCIYVRGIGLLIKHVLPVRGNIDSCILHDFPHGYTLYNHKKGDKHVPRKDTYLLGLSSNMTRRAYHTNFKEYEIRF